MCVYALGRRHGGCIIVLAEVGKVLGLFALAEAVLRHALHLGEPGEELLLLGVEVALAQDAVLAPRDARRRLVQSRRRRRAGIALRIRQHDWMDQITIKCVDRVKGALQLLSNRHM